MIKFLDSVDSVLRKLLVALAGAFLLAMLAITVANIAMRKIGMPINGTYELTGLFGAVVCACVLGYTQKRKENIAVDILVKHLPARLRLVAAIINDTACAGFSILAAWQIIKIGLRHLHSGEVTETLRIVAYPFIFIASAGFAALAFVFIIDLFKNFVIKDTSVHPLSTSVEVPLEEGVE